MARIIVTGGLGVLGAAACSALLDRGDAVGLIDRPATPTRQLPQDVRYVGCDLADETEVRAAYAELTGMLGGLDGVANIAGGFTWEPVESGTSAAWDAMDRINLRTALGSCRAALAYLRNGGAIVNVGAAASLQPGAGMAPYAASKAGVLALTLSLAAELKGRGIRVNAILPTVLDTPTNRVEMPDADKSEWVQPSAAADVIAFLLSDAASAINGVGLPLSHV